MATTIVTKYGSDAPAASDIVRGELAVDTENGRLYTENAAGAVVEIGLKPEANVDVTGTITASGVVTANAGVVVDNFTLDGTTLALSSGDLTLDVAGDIVLDSDNGAFRFKDAGTTLATFTSDSGSMVLYNATADKDLIFKGNDGGSTVTALSLDMSAAGAATFNAGVTAQTLTATNGYLYLDDDGSHNGIINVPATLYLNLDSDANSAGEGFIIGKDRTGTTGGTELFRVQEDGKVGIGTSSPNYSLTSYKIGANANYLQVVNGSSGPNAANGILYGLDGAGNGVINKQGAGDLITSVNGLERMRIDGATGNVAIGHTAGTAILDVRRGDASGKIAEFHTNTGYGIEIGSSQADAYISSGYAQNFQFKTGNTATTRMTISNAGNVGIGISSLVNPLEVKLTSNTASKTTGSAFDGAAIRLNGELGPSTNSEIAILAGQNDTLSAGIGFLRENSSTWGTALKFYTRPSATTGGTDDIAERMRITSAGALQLSDTNSPNDINTAIYSNSDVLEFEAFGTNGAIAFSTGSGVTEAARFDSSQNFLVGTTSTDTAAVGFRYRSSLDAISSVADGGISAYFGRRSSDGDIVALRKDDTIIGSLATYSSTMQVGQGNVYLKFANATDSISPANGNGTDNDDSLDLGQSGARFDDIYATNGTIQTSDRNEKQDIAELSDAEQRVAVACKGLLRKFRWKSSVAEKGDEARTHFGIIAQDLQAAFAAEGLNAGDYAMFISTTWTDEETNEERTRMGVRYSELLAFIISAI